jgi:Sulfite exporter TauE/SafE
MDGLTWTVFALAAFVSGFSGFAMGLVVSGAWLHIITPLQTAALIAGYGLLTQGYGIVKLRRALNWRAIWPLALGSAVGIPVGVYVLTYIDPLLLRAGVGAVLMTYSAYSLLRPAIGPFAIGPGGDLAIGFAARLGRRHIDDLLSVARVAERRTAGRLPARSVRSFRHHQRLDGIRRRVHVGDIRSLCRRPSVSACGSLGRFQSLRIDR